MLTTLDLDTHVCAGLAAGASGFLPEDIPEGQLIGAIRAIAAGNDLFAPTVTHRLIHYLATQHLTPTRAPALRNPDRPGTRDPRAARHSADNADTFHISEHTVRTHVARILADRQLHDRAQAIVLAYETGLVRAGTPNTATNVTSSDRRSRRHRGFTLAASLVLNKGCPARKVKQAVRTSPGSGSASARRRERTLVGRHRGPVAAS